MDGHPAPVHYANGRVSVHADPGTHVVILTVSDYQELKNMEDVAPIMPNTTILRKQIVVR